jgi:amino acid transporter
LIVGIIVGAGIYRSSPTVAQAMGSATGSVVIWLVGGILALAGALSYAELATCYPQEGGDYVYLRRAFGKAVGFLFGWSQLVIVRPADIAIMAFVFAEYAQAIYPIGPQTNNLGPRIYAVAAVVILTSINILGVRQGKWTQNILTVAKVLGLAAVVIVGLLAPRPGPVQALAGPATPAISLALIFVLFTFGGWNEMAYVAAEVRDPAKNIVKAMVIGTALVTGLYVLVNIAFLNALGFGGLAGSSAVAVETVRKVLPSMAAKVVAALICISALGAVNGLIFTGARISYALGQGHKAFGPLGLWHQRLGTPLTALALQGLLSIAIALASGSFFQAILYTAPVVWLFFLGTGMSLFVLRFRQPLGPRPYKVFGYPFTPAVFCLCCGFMLVSCIRYALANRPAAMIVLAGVLVVGMLVYNLTENRLGSSRRGNPG